MINRITVINPADEEIEIELKRPEKSGFFIKNITGLGPGRANINSTDISNYDGSIFNSARIEKRNIVITLGFYYYDKETIEDIRLKSYKYFPLKEKITLIIETDNRECIIEGYVERNEPDIFNKEETAQISIICPDPYFRDSMQSKFNLYGIEPMFEFIYENPITEDNKNTIFSVVNNRHSKTFYYEGDANVGAIFDIVFKDYVTGLELVDNKNRVILGINDESLTSIISKAVEDGLIKGDTKLQNKDEIIISTVNGSKSAIFVRDGVKLNIINALGKNVKWLTFSKGPNTFAFITTPVEMIEHVYVTMRCDTLYKGV